MSEKTTWHAELKKAFAENNDDFDKMVTTMGDKELHTAVDVYKYTNFRYRATCDDIDIFMAWGEKNVYFRDGYRFYTDHDTAVYEIRWLERMAFTRILKEAAQKMRKGDMRPS